MAGLKIPVSVELGNSLQNLNKVQGAINNLGNSADPFVQAVENAKAAIIDFAKGAKSFEDIQPALGDLVMQTGDLDKALEALKGVPFFDEFMAGMDEAVKGIEELNSKDIKPGISISKQLSQARNELKAMIAQYGELSPQVTAAAEKVRELEKITEDAAEATQRVDFGKGTAQFANALGDVVKGAAGVAGGLAAIGISGEDAEKSLLKLQGALAFAESLKSMGALGDSIGKVGKSGLSAFKAISNAIAGATGATATFSSVLAATGVGLLAIGIGLAVNAISEYNQAIDDAAESVGKLREEKERLLSLSDNVIKNNDAYIGRQKEIIQNEEKIKNLELDHNKNIDEIAKLKTKNLDLSIQNYNAELKTKEGLIDADTELAIKAKIYRAEREKERIVIEANLEKAKLAADKKKELTAKEIAEQKKRNAAIQAADKVLFDASVSLKSEEGAELAKLEAKFWEDVKVLQAAGNTDYLTLLTAFESARAGIVDKYALKRADAAKEEAEKLRQIQIANNQARASLDEQFEELMISSIEDNGKRRQAEIDKNFRTEIGKWTAFYSLGLINEDTYQKALLALKGNYQKQTEENTLANIDKLSKITNEGIEAGLEDAMAALGDALASGEDPFQALTKSLLTSLGNMATALGKEIFTLGVIFKALEKTLKKLGPGGKIAVGLALIAFGAAVNAAVSKNAKRAGFARGGFVNGPGTETSDSVPAQLSKGEYVIKARSVRKYGKDLFEKLNRGIPEPEPWRAIVNRPATDPSRALVNRSQAMRFAYGGFINGPGTETSDSIPAQLSRGEFVIQAKMVKKYGKTFFDRLNSGIPEPEPWRALVNRTAMDPSRALVNRSQVMKFAQGGYVDPFSTNYKALVNRFESNPLGLDSTWRALVNRPLPDTPRVVTGNVQIGDGISGGIIAETKISGQDLKIILHRADRRYSNAT